jgi:hypothetical protein
VLIIEVCNLGLETFFRTPESRIGLVMQRLVHVSIVLMRYHLLQALLPTCLNIVIESFMLQLL